MDKKLPGIFDRPTPTDPLEEARHTFKKGRFEFLGGPVYYRQGNESADGIKDNNRECTYGYPMGTNTDPMAHDLGVDETEQ